MRGGCLTPERCCRLLPQPPAQSAGAPTRSRGRSPRCSPALRPKPVSSTLTAPNTTPRAGGPPQSLPPIATGDAQPPQVSVRVPQVYQGGGCGAPTEIRAKVRVSWVYAAGGCRALTETRSDNPALYRSPSPKPACWNCAATSPRPPRPFPVLRPGRKCGILAVIHGED